MLSGSDNGFPYGICVGGWPNDSFLKYTRQLLTFSRLP